MTEGQLSHLRNEILGASLDAEQAVLACRLRLSLIGQHLKTIGLALEEHPEEINPLPEPTSALDYRKQIEILRICLETKWIVSGADERRRCGSWFRLKYDGVRSLC